MTISHFLLAIYDSCGISGAILQYALAISFVVGAFLIFTGLWLKSRLDLDESPKYQMFNDHHKAENHD
jgi:hypothetical protein